MSRLMSQMSAVFLVGGPVFLAVGGCETHSSTRVTSAAAERRENLPRIPEELLRQHGLETLWYNEPRDVDAGVHSAELLADSLFVASMPKSRPKGSLRRVLRTSGETVWYFDLDEPLKAPPTAFLYPPGTSGKPNEIYFTQLDTVHCVDFRAGDLLWKQQLKFPVSTRIGADDQSYFVGSDTGRVYGIPKRSALEDWTFRTKNVIRATPLVEGTDVFVASADGSITRLPARKGFVQGTSWQRATGSRVVADMTAYSRWVFAGSTDYKLYCLESQDGSSYWTFAAEAPVEDPPVVYSYQSNQEYVYCIATEKTAREENRTLFSLKLTTGEEVWRAQKVRKIVSIGKRTLYVLNDPKSGEAESLVAIDVLSGKEKFRISIRGFNFIPTNMADHGRNQKERGRIYLVAEDGTIQTIGERL